MTNLIVPLQQQAILLYCLAAVAASTVRLPRGGHCCTESLLAATLHALTRARLAQCCGGMGPCVHVRRPCHGTSCFVRIWF